MPIGNMKTSSANNEKSSTFASASDGQGRGARTTFRPPWVKADVPEPKPKTTMKTTTPWSKKNTSTVGETSSDTINKNGDVQSIPLTKKPLAMATKAPVAKKSFMEPVPQKESKLQSREIKVPIVTQKRIMVHEPLINPKTKKPPTPSESEEEEEEEEEETETESESESESQTEERKPIPLKREESELERKFKTEKPKLRPVVIKRDKSVSSALKKPQGEIGDEAKDGETEEELERQQRFKLERPKLRHVVVNKQKSFNNSTEDLDKIRPVLRKVQKVEGSKEPLTEKKPEFKDKVLRKVTSIKKDPSKPNVPAPPPVPSLVPKPPPPPPPPLRQPDDFEKKELSGRQKATLEKLRTRPRKRPDWSQMMKEVEGGKKLRHVQCNDRSQPIITCKSMTKVDDKFVYETEKDNAHNKLLKQIQGGIKLKPVKTNDRSKPFLDGLRKFRRQMTIEEQIQKSESRAALDEVAQSPEEPSGDELDDIDKLRDDLQSTKQMLALELRNREAQEREIKRLLAKIATLEAELIHDKTRFKTEDSSKALSVEPEDEFVKTLKKDAEDARKISKELETKYQKSAEELDAAKNEIEEQRRMIAQMEKKLAQAMQGGSTSSSMNDRRRVSEATSNKESSPEIEVDISESDEDEDEEKKVERKKRRITKEVKSFQTKLTKLKSKEEAEKKERTSLKQQIKKNHILLKEEKKKFKKLEKEVHKMAASMKEGDDETGEGKDTSDGEEQEEEAESNESNESDSDESEEESDCETESESEPDDATDEVKKDSLEPRVKKHENRLSVLKKGNVLLQANVDNLQDEITKVREKASSLQCELDAVLSDLGL